MALMTGFQSLRLPLVVRTPNPTIFPELRDGKSEKDDANDRFHETLKERISFGTNGTQLEPKRISVALGIPCNRR